MGDAADYLEGLTDIADALEVLDGRGCGVEAFPDREAWLAARDVDHRIGASNIAKILGVPKGASSWPVWNAKKLGLRQRFSQQQLDDFERGHVWEGRVIEDYQRETGVEARQVHNLIVTHPSKPWAAISPDGFVSDEGWIGGIEAKTDRNPQLWGESGQVIEEWGPGCEAIVRPEYALQVFFSLAVSGFDFWELAVYLARRRDFPELRHFRIMRDDRVQAEIMGRVERWRERYLLGDEEPPLDGSDAARQSLICRFPGSADKVTREATDDEADAMTELAQTQLSITRDKRRVEVLKQTLALAIGDDYGLTMGRNGKALWVPVKGRNGGPGHRSVRLYGMEG